MKETVQPTFASLRAQSMLRAEEQMMEPVLGGRSAVVLGGTSGIGRELALGLAKAGADVIASSRSQATVSSVAEELRALGRRTLAATSDVTDRASLDRLHELAVREFGKVDILVNAAGITQRVPTLECAEDLWSSILDVNLHGTFRACQVFGRSMLEREYGRIINIASLATFVAFQEVAAYCVSKAAVGALTRSLAVEWAPRKVCVNAIAPGVFPTALNSRLLESPRGQELLMRNPMGRFGELEELVSTAIYLASDASSYTTGQVLVVDGGQLASGVNR